MAYPMQEQMTPVLAVLGIGTGIGAVVDLISAGLAILVALVSLVALGYNIHLKRKQIKFINKDLYRGKKEDT